MTNAPALVLIGFGQVGEALLRESRARGDGPVRATTRSETRAPDIAARGATPCVLTDADRALPAAVHDGDDVVVSFPPDGSSDAAYASALGAARRIVYISSTGVYGSVRGRIDETTAVDRSDGRAAQRLEAEDVWRGAGAIVLRAPAIYGPRSGLHRRLLAGTFRLVDDGARHVSRIHVDDLAVLALAALERAAPRSTYVLGDRAPSTQRDVVEWLCARLALPLPPVVSERDAQTPHRGDRIIDGGRALRELAVTLRYPSYRDGYDAVLRAEGRV